MSTKKVYKIIFYNQDEVFQIYASFVYPSDMYGFIEVEQLLFGETSQVLVDPSEEKLKAEFSGVKRTFIPMNAVVRIDEVEQEGIAKVKPAGANVTSLPSGQGSKPKG